MTEARTKNLIVVAAAVTATGLFVLATGSRNLGGAFVLAGWALFIAAIHYFGRLGAREEQN